MTFWTKTVNRTSPKTPPEDLKLGGGDCSELSSGNGRPFGNKTEREVKDRRKNRAIALEVETLRIQQRERLSGNYLIGSCRIVLP